MRTYMSALFFLVSLFPHCVLPTLSLQACGEVELVCQECPSHSFLVLNPTMGNFCWAFATPVFVSWLD